MAQLVKQSTAATILIGPFVDKDDALTPETSLAAGTVDEIGVYKHDGTAIVDISGTTTFTHRAGGMYTATLSTSDTGTLGRMTFYCRDDSVCLPVWSDYTILPANTYDSIVAGSDKLDVSTVEWLGTAVTTSSSTSLPEVDAKSISNDATAANNLESMYDGTGYVGGTIKLGVDTVAISGDTTAADNAELDYDGTGYAKANSTIGTATTIGATGIAAIWSYAKASAAALATSTMGRYVYDKLSFLTSSTTITLTSGVATGGVITIYQGEGRQLSDGTHISFDIDGTVTDLTGFTPKLGITKLTSNSGTTTLEISGTVLNAGASNQSVYFEYTKAQTAALALDTAATHSFRISSNYAYRYTAGATDSGTDCPTIAQGKVSVLARDITC